MKKRTITVGLASAALTGGITVAAVAQGCVSDGRNATEDVANIVIAVNTLNGYNGTAPTNMLSTEILERINGSLEIDSQSFTATSLTIATPITSIDVSITQTGYLVSNVQLTGRGTLGTSNSDIYDIAGTASINVSIQNQNLVASSVSGLSSTDVNAQVTAVVDAVNALSTYDTNVVVSGLSSFLLQELNRDLIQGSDAFTITELRYDSIIASDVMATNTGYQVSISSVLGSGTAGSEMYTISGDATFNFTIADNMLTVAAETGLQTTNVAVEQNEILMAINELRNYSGTTPSITLASSILAMIANSTQGTTNFQILALSFTQITILDIMMTPSGFEARNISITGNGVSDDNTPFGLSGDLVIDFGVNAGSVTVGEVSGLVTTDVNGNLTTIIDSVNSLSDYVVSGSAPTGLALEVLTAVRNHLREFANGFEVHYMTFTSITTGDVTFNNNNNTFSVRIPQARGFGTAPQPEGAVPFAYFGTATISISNRNNTLTVESASNLSSRAPRLGIVEAVMEISNYNGSGTPNLEIARQILALIETQVDSADAGDTIASLTINNIDGLNVRISADNLTMEFINLGISGTTTNGSTISSTGGQASVTLTISPNGSLVASSVTGLTIT